MAMGAFIREGYRIAIPLGENNRYDIIVHREGVFFRVQVKTGRLRKGVVLFSPWSVNSNRGRNSWRTYAGEIDSFAVYCPETSLVYHVPVADVGTCGSLRVERPKNGQSRRIRWARPYELGPAISPAKIAGKVGTKPGDGVPSTGSGFAPL
jgi:hypothetical protein